MPRTVHDFGGGIGEASLSVLLELWTVLGLPVAVLTNSALISREDVREELAAPNHRHFGTMRPRHVEALRLLPD